MQITCPKCRHVRQPAETAPEWQCPACGVAYAKVADAAGAASQAAPAANRHAGAAVPLLGSITWFKLFVIGCLAYGAWVGAQRIWRAPPPGCGALAAFQSHGAFESAQVAFLSDGLRIGALLTKPKGPGPFPVYVHNHGSMTRTQALGPLWSTPEAIDSRLAAAGYVVLRPARRGNLGSEGSSSTYWTQTASLNASDVIKGAYEEAGDVHAAIAYLQACPFVEKRRIAVGGYSVGGITVVAAAAKRRDLAGVIIIAGGITWIQNGVQQGYPAVSAVWRNEAGNLSAPMLLLYGRNDTAVIPALGEELAALLTQRSVPVTLTIYPGDHYSFPIDEIAGFLDEHVKGR
jgi:dienelactone hydrolase